MNALFSLQLPIVGDGVTTSFTVRLRDLPSAVWNGPTSGAGVPEDAAFSGIYGAVAVNEPTNSWPVTVTSSSLSGSDLTINLNTALHNAYIYIVNASLLSAV